MYELARTRTGRNPQMDFSAEWYIGALAKANGVAADCLQNSESEEPESARLDPVFCKDFR